MFSFPQERLQFFGIHSAKASLPLSLAPALLKDHRGHCVHELRYAARECSFSLSLFCNYAAREFQSCVFRIYLSFFCRHRLYAGSSSALISTSVKNEQARDYPRNACPVNCSYKRVTGRSHTVEKRKASHPQKPHATSQPSRLSHTPRLSTDAAHN